MHPRLFTFLDIPFPSYFALLGLGFVLATAIGALWARRLGHDPDVVVDLGILMVIAGVLGARLAHVLFDGDLSVYVNLCTQPSQVSWKITQAECLRPIQADWLLGGGEGVVGVWDAAAGVCRPRQADCWAWARFWEGGLTYYGGLLLASAAAFWQLRRDRFPFLRAADMAGMVVPVGLCFGRLGCVLGGCCFGSPTSVAWALRFPAYSPAAEQQLEMGLLHSHAESSLSVHPTQLYEAAGSLAIAGFLIFYLHQRKRYDGQVFVGFLGLYALLRFLLEFWRADDRGGWLALSTSQWIGLTLLGAAVWIHRTRVPRTRTAA